MQGLQFEQYIMNKPVISFGAGCAINLDDLGQFPDYYEIITKLIAQLKQNKQDMASLNTFLDADLQDVQHIPQFKQLIQLLIQKYNELFSNSENLKGKLLVLLLKIVKSYFTSYSIQQQQAKPLLEVLTKQLKLYTEYWIDFLLSIALFAPYAEKHEQIIQLLLNVTNQQEIFASSQFSLNYIKSIDKILRFRQFRLALSQKLTQKQLDNKKIPFLLYKYGLHQFKKGDQKIQQLFLKFQTSIDSNKVGEFMKQYIKSQEQKINIK